MKKTINKLITSTIIGLLMTSAVTTYAKGYEETIFATFNSLNIYLEDTKVDGGTLLYNGTTYLPLRSTANALGLEVVYSQAEQSINLFSNTGNVTEVTTNNTSTRKYDEEINVHFNTLSLYLDGGEINGETLLYNGTTYLPLRATAETLGLSADYNGVTKTVTLTKSMGEPQEIGSFANPVPLGNSYTWEGKTDGAKEQRHFKDTIVVKEVIRGDKAYELSQYGNQHNPTPEPHEEIILVYIDQTLTFTTSNGAGKQTIGRNNYGITSTDGIDYIYDSSGPGSGVVRYLGFTSIKNDFVVAKSKSPRNEPVGEPVTVEGYIGFVIDKNDTNPKLVYNENVYFELTK